MCFNKKYSAVFAIMGIISLFVVKKNPPTGNNLLYIPIIFYTLMEILQTVQYNYVNKCDYINRFLTEISYLLVLVQPLMWNLIFFNKKRSPVLTQFQKGILYCGIILCIIWICGHILRRFNIYSKYNPSKDDSEFIELTSGENTCTYKNKDEHLYWNYELFSNPGFDANWFMYLALWFIPALLIPGEKITIAVLALGLIISYLYVKIKNHNRHITPSLWCLSSAPTLVLNVFLYSILKI